MVYTIFVLYFWLLWSISSRPHFHPSELSLWLSLCCFFMGVIYINILTEIHTQNTIEDCETKKMKIQCIWYLILKMYIYSDLYFILKWYSLWPNGKKIFGLFSGNAMVLWSSIFIWFMVYIKDIKGKIISLWIFMWFYYSFQNYDLMPTF